MPNVNKPRCSALLACLAALLALWPTHASAAAVCGGETASRNFIWYYYHMTAGTTYTIETANITGDTVMHLLQWGGGVYHQVASDDDSAGNFASRIVYTPSATGDCYVLVRSHSNTSNGLADLRINGVTLLTQNPYGSYVWIGANWNSGERARVTATRRGATQDPMLFVLSSNTQITQVDDDSGPNRYSLIDFNSTANSNSRLVWGNYPGGTVGANFRATIEPVYAAAGDADKDGLMASLEQACGLSDSLVDTDKDVVPDNLELFGNDGFSFSLGSQWGGNPTRRNLYVEIDTMNKADKVPPPDANLAADMAYIFNTDGAIDTYVESDGAAPSLPYTPNVAMTNCGTVLNCTTMTAIRAANFSTAKPERQPYFHYVVYGNVQVDERVNPPTTTNSSGVAEILGTNVLVTLGTDNWAATAQMRRGTTVHELGHNLNLDHNHNDDVSKNFSVIHGSVMNYKYQFWGVPWRAAGAVLGSTYSFGANTCALCTTSPKQWCLFANMAAYYTGTTCYQVQAYSTCDCDVNEWGSLLTTDFRNGTRNTTGAGAGGAASGAADSLLPPLGPSEFATTRAAIERNQVSAPQGLLKATSPGTWQGPVPDDGSARRGALVKQQLVDLKARGLVRDKDFYVSSDGLSIMQTCL